MTDDVPHIYAIDIFENKATLEIGANLQLAEKDQLRRIITNCYVNSIGIEVEPFDYKMNIRLTTDVLLQSTKIWKKQKCRKPLRNYYVMVS